LGGHDVPQERNEGDAAAVRAELEKWSDNDIAAWHRSYYDHHNALHRALLLSAAWVILGECSSDGFHYFKAWVIGKGRRAYEMAIADPDSLGIFITRSDLDGDCDNERLNYAAEKAYQAHGRDRQELKRNSNEFEQPTGESTDLDRLAAVLPKLTARFPNWLR
jgi:Protein of unknown function (DUF4240)